MSGRPVRGPWDDAVSAMSCWYCGTWSERVGHWLMHSLWWRSNCIAWHPVHHIVSLQLHWWTTVRLHTAFWVCQLIRSSGI